jgi:HK97 family phage prohead protease
MSTEYKNLRFEIKDITNKGEILMKHSTFNNVDRVDDIVEPQAFDEQYKSVKASDIGFYFNHHSDQVIGTTQKVYRDNEAAYTLAMFSKDSLGQGVQEMVMQKAITAVSMGYVAEKKEYVYNGSKRVRKLQKIRHLESSLLTKTPANPLATIVDVKSYQEASNYIEERRALIANLERFYYNSKKAPDSLLKQVHTDIQDAKKELKSYVEMDYNDQLDDLERRLEKEKKDIDVFRKDINRIEFNLLLNKINRML